MVKVKKSVQENNLEISKEEIFRNQYFFAMPMSFLSGIGHGLCMIAPSWWLKSLNFSYTNITLLTVVNVSFGLKFLWIPIFDRFDFSFAWRKLSKFLGLRAFLPKSAINVSAQRKFPMTICIFISSFFLFSATFFSPVLNIKSFCLCIFLGAFWLASGEAIMIAYNLETLRPKNMGITTAAYRIGLFLSSWVLVFLNETYGVAWVLMFRFMSILMSIMACSAFFAPSEKKDYIKKTWSESLINPYFDLAKRYGLALLATILFIVLYKSRDRLSDPVNNLFIRDTSNLNSYNFFFIKAFSTFILATSAIKSGFIIEKYNYRLAFIISIIMNFLNVLTYLIYSFQTTTTYLICIVLSIFGYGIFWYLSSESTNSYLKKTDNKSFLKISNLVLLTIFFALILYIVCIKFDLTLSTFIANLPMISILFLVVSDKITSGLKASVLYSYQMSLCSKNYALSQATIISSLELSTSYFFLQPLSGLLVDSLGWKKFYLLNLFLSICPLIMYSAIINRKSHDES